MVLMSQTPQAANLHIVSRLAKLGYYKWGAEGSAYHDVSEEYAALHSLTRHEMLSQYQDREADIRRWIHPEDVDLYLENDRKHEANPHQWTLEYRMRDIEGRTIYISETAEPQFDDNGKLISWIGICQDITARVERERADKAILNEAKERAEQASTAKTEFLSSMSHELRTPLNSVLGFAQLLMTDTKEPLCETHQHFVALIQTSGHHLLSLIEEVLELSKVESGKVGLAIGDVSVVPLIEDCVLVAKPLMGDKTISFSVINDLAPDVSCHGDEKRMRQVLINLISNAVKYNSDPGRVRIHISNGVENMVRISVSDTGRGIANENMEKLFIAFDRLGLESSNIEGNGIGLTIAKRLTEAMGGNIGADSNVGEGSVFWIDLPDSTRFLTDEDRVENFASGWGL